MHIPYASNAFASATIPRQQLLWRRRQFLRSGDVAERWLKLFGGLVWCLVRHGFVMDANPTGRICCDWIMKRWWFCSKEGFLEKELISWPSPYRPWCSLALNGCDWATVRCTIKLDAGDDDVRPFPYATTDLAALISTQLS